ncbi:MAG: TetR/AcrR family transcriptional regulator [Acidothermales bacterium]|nr:TetR/AcrR family transcriptional regulator [Acidothermales bacterium]
MSTDSERADRTTRPGKREWLVAAALELVYRNGVARTSLADIAKAADVPVGNVYYYFKTKDDIVNAVVDAHRERLESSLADLERRHRGPRTRLKALGALLADQRDAVARYGCPYGTLSSELAKQRSDGSDPLAATLLRMQLDWAEQQFRAMGRRDAADLATELIAAVQGSAVLSNALGRPGLMSRRARRLDRWIDALGTS